jgi:hypothetical protein
VGPASKALSRFSISWRRASMAAPPCCFLATCLLHFTTKGFGAKLSIHPTSGKMNSRKFKVASSAGPVGLRDLDRGKAYSEPVLMP